MAKSQAKRNVSAMWDHLTSARTADEVTIMLSSACVRVLQLKKLEQTPFQNVWKTYFKRKDQMLKKKEKECSSSNQSVKPVNSVSCWNVLDPAGVSI